jgi:hypothetical protein
MASVMTSSGQSRSRRVVNHLAHYQQEWGEREYGKRTMPFGVDRPTPAGCVQRTAARMPTESARRAAG